MSFKTVGNKIIVKEIAVEEKTVGGILLPDSAKEKANEGEIISVGPGRILETGAREEMNVKVGDHIIFSKYGHSEVKISGEEYIVLSQDDVLVVIEK